MIIGHREQSGWLAVKPAASKFSRVYSQVYSRTVIKQSIAYVGRSKTLTYQWQSLMHALSFTAGNKPNLHDNHGTSGSLAG